MASILDALKPTSRTGNIKYNTPDWWDAAIKHSLEIRKRHSHENRWDDYEDYWNNGGDEFAEGEPAMNMVFMYGRTLVPSIAFARPTIINTVRPRGLNGIEQSLIHPLAAIYDSIDAYLMDEMEAPDVFQDSVLFSYLYNMAPIEIGFDFPDQPGRDANDFFRQAVAAQASFENKEGVVDRARRQNFPWVDLIPPRQFIPDPTNRNGRKMRWYAKVAFVPTRLLKKDKSLNQRNVKPTHLGNDVIGDHFRQVTEEMAGFEEFTMVYEIHEAEEGTMQWLTADMKPLFDPVPDPMQIDGLPIEMMSFNKNPASIWGTPDVSYIEPMMLDFNERLFQNLRQVRLANLRFLFEQGVIDEDEIEKIFSDDVVALRLKKPPRQ